MSFEQEKEFVAPSLPPWHISPFPQKSKSNLELSFDAETLGFLPSPLNRLKTKKPGKSSNHHQEMSFEVNQSFPKMSRKSRQEFCDDLVKSESSFSFDRQNSILSSNRSMDSSTNTKYTTSFDTTSRSIGNLQTRHIWNPNKLILCLDKNNKITLCNTMACQILGYKRSELQNMSLEKLILNLERRLSNTSLETLDEMEVLCAQSSSGIDDSQLYVRGTVLVCGKVVEVQTKLNGIRPMSLWLKDLSTEEHEKKLAILEPVERIEAKIRVSKDEHSNIFWMDSEAERIFGISLDSVIGKPIQNLLPNIQTETNKEDAQQKTVGLTSDGNQIPVVIERDSSNEILTVWVYSNLSGLLILSAEGSIESFNVNFMNLLLGYSAMDLKGKKIVDVIPGFFEEIALDDDDVNPEPPKTNNKKFGKKLNFSLDSLKETTTTDSSNNISPKKSPKPTTFFEEEDKENYDYHQEIQTDNIYNNHSSNNLVSQELHQLTSTPAGTKLKSNIQLRSDFEVEFPEGCFFGLGKHKDGAEISILYQIRKITLEDGSFMYCLWIAKDLEEQDLGSRFGTLTLASKDSSSTLDKSLGESIRKAAKKRMDLRFDQLYNTNSKLVVSPSKKIDTNFALYQGTYQDNYCTLEQIGSGAFGCVKNGFRRSDKKMVVTKFIQKSKVYEENWVSDTLLNMRVPLEISLLSTLNHPNIINVLDVHENEEYLQLVMEKHGSGMDLFEFLARRPTLDEPLASYIYRQVVSAMDYLHNDCGLLHRDIKDENIIINHNFLVKLIDFGSVAPIPKDGWLFSTFYGTVEYCSPEVLNGHCYAGPELEMWTMGFLLYVLMFNENPFYDVQETLTCQLQPPFAVSPLCLEVIKKLLCKDPEIRMKLDQLKEHPWLNQLVCIEEYKFSEIVPCSDEELNPIQYYNETKKTKNEDIMSYISNEALNDSVCSLSDSLLNILE